MKKYYVQEYQGRVLESVPKGDPAEGVALAERIATNTAPQEFATSAKKSFIQFKIDLKRNGLCINTKSELLAFKATEKDVDDKAAEIEKELSAAGLNAKQIEAAEAYATHALGGDLIHHMRQSCVRNDSDLMPIDVLPISCIIDVSTSPKVIINLELSLMKDEKLKPFGMHTIELDLSAIAESTDLTKFAPKVTSKLVLYEAAASLNLTDDEKKLLGTEKEYSKDKWLQDNPLVLPSMMKIVPLLAGSTKYSPQAVQDQRLDLITAAFARLDDVHEKEEVEPLPKRRNYSCAKLITFSVLGAAIGTGVGLVAAKYLALSAAASVATGLGVVAVIATVIFVGSIISEICKKSGAAPKPQDAPRLQD